MAVTKGKDLNLNAASRWRRKATDEAFQPSSLHSSSHKSDLNWQGGTELFLNTGSQTPWRGNGLQRQHSTPESPDHNPQNWINQQKLVVVSKMNGNDHLRSGKKARGIKRRANNTLHWVFILSRSVTWPLLGVLNYLTVGFNTITYTVQTKKHYKIISAQSHHFCMSYRRHFNVCKWPPVT